MSPAILEEYADVLGDHSEFVAEIVESFLSAIHSPSSVSFGTNPTTVFSNARLPQNAAFIVTVNTAPGHFDQKQYQT